MKKHIEITRQSTDTIEVEVPSFYNKNGMHIAITDHSVIKVAKDGSFITFWLAAKQDRYSEAVEDALRWSPEPITEQEFDIAFNNAIKCLTEQYQLSKSMILDPNKVAEQNAATGEVIEEVTDQTEATNEAATESAAQDSAMGVDSEEGGAEG